jgi:hypothetical protein
MREVALERRAKVRGSIFRFSSVKEVTQKNLSDALSALVVWRGGALCTGAIDTASVAFFLIHGQLQGSKVSGKVLA